jgi:hypothetical protein
LTFLPLVHTEEIRVITAGLKLHCCRVEPHWIKAAPLAAMMWFPGLMTDGGSNEDPPGWLADDPWDDLWENQGKAEPLTVGTLARAVSQAVTVSSRARELPFVVELYDNTGARRRLMVTGISFTGDGDMPDAVTMTVTPAD